MMTNQLFATLPLTRIIITVGLVVVILLTALPSLGQRQLPIITNVLGIAGGGSISIDRGNAHVSLMTTNITPRAGDNETEDPEPVTVGQVKWLVSSEDDYVVLCRAPLSRSTAPCQATTASGSSAA